MNWELMLPGRVYSGISSETLYPMSSVRVTVRGRCPEEHTHPCFFNSSVRGDSGLSGSLPLPVKCASLHSAAATGIIKRAVEPLSPQLRTTRSGTALTGVTRILPAF